MMVTCSKRFMHANTCLSGSCCPDGRVQDLRICLHRRNVCEPLWQAISIQNPILKKKSQNQNQILVPKSLKLIKKKI